MQARLILILPLSAVFSSTATTAEETAQPAHASGHEVKHNAHAGTIDATTVLLVTDIHLWKGLAIQAGPGVERVEGETLTIGRLGLLYEFTKEKFTIAPMVHYDFGASESSLIVGVAFGRAF